ncbi:PHD finger-containing protein 1-like [Apium graveolens]|uniref:PHD finger-containing protein 1-like n=1 Tax=Apium graveolens TaxID=4045 RepID=UPI003D7A5D07
MATTCLKCGSQSWDNAFVSCTKCQDCVLHRYCLDIIPDTLDEIVTWYCEDCQEDVTPSTEEAHGFGSKNIRDTNTTDIDEQMFEDGSSHGVHSRQKQNSKSNSMENKQESCLVPDGHDSVQGLLIHSSSSNGEFKKLQASSCCGEDSRLISNTAHNPDVCEILYLDNPNSDGCEILYLDNPTPLQQDLQIPAQPVEDPIWRGDFVISNKKKNNYDGFVAHISNKACSKVCEEARSLNKLLHFEMHPKSDVWPKSFQKSPPGDENIALYFLPADIGSEKVFDGLVEYMMGHELGLKATVENAELLLFTSIELPLLYWRFQGRYYLWGVFRGKQTA